MGVISHPTCIIKYYCGIIFMKIRLKFLLEVLYAEHETG
jgi:hypothetical protein